MYPPYANIIKYSDGLENDLSQLKVKDFLEQMKPVAKECYRVLKKKNFEQFLWEIQDKKVIWFL